MINVTGYFEIFKIKWTVVEYIFHHSHSSLYKISKKSVPPKSQDSKLHCKNINTGIAESHSKCGASRGGCGVRDGRRRTNKGSKNTINSRSLLLLKPSTIAAERCQNCTAVAARAASTEKMQNRRSVT